MKKFRVSICICTRNRPDELRTALASILRSTIPPYQIIVSDDSTDDRTERLLSEGYPHVYYAHGPRMGLCANRNNALRLASGSHVLFLDDDSSLGEHFLAHILRTIEADDRTPRGLLIVSGTIEERDGRLVLPHDQSFLGFQNRPYRPGEPYCTVVLGSTVFPRELFQTLRFDEQLVYGYDEVDLATRATRIGFRILLCPNAVNYHFPSSVNREYYAPYIDASRLYVTVKRYYFTEGRRLKGLACLFVGLLHATAYQLKTGGLPGLRNSRRTVFLVAGYLSRYLTRSSQRA